MKAAYKLSKFAKDLQKSKSLQTPRIKTLLLKITIIAQYSDFDHQVIKHNNPDSEVAHTFFPLMTNHFFLFLPFLCLRGRLR